MDYLNKPQLAAAIAVGILGALTIWIVPGFVKLAAQHAALDVHQMGYVASADIDFMAVSIAITTFLIPRVRWRVLVLWGISLIAVGNLASAAVHEYLSLSVARLIVGAGEGLCVGVAFAAFGRARTPARAFSIYMISGACVSAMILMALPALQKGIGSGGVFLAAAALAGLVAIGTRWFPSGETALAAAGDGSAGAIRWPLAVMALIGVFLYFFAQGAVWSYFGRIAELNQIDPGTVSRALAAGTLAGIAGASLSGVLPSRFQRSGPVAGSAIVSAVAFLTLLIHLDTLLVSLCAVLIVAAWNFAQPLLSALCCEADPRGRVVCAMGCVQTVGFGLGPAAAALLFDGRRFSLVIWMSTTALVAAVAVLLVGFRTATGDQRGNRVSLA
jgi:predicted MFS family arabinose efflux permease